MEGLVVTEHGRGSFVRARRPLRRLGSPRPFEADEESGSSGALLRRSPLRTVRATHRGTRLEQPGEDPSGASPSIPHTGSPPVRSPQPWVAASNLSFGSGLCPSSLGRATCPRQRPFGPGIRLYPASYPETAGGGASHRLRFPVAFRLPAFACWASCPAEGLGLPYGRLTRRHWGLDPVGVSTFRTRKMRPGRAPCVPRDGGALPARLPCSGWRLPHSSGPSSTPLLHPIGGATVNEASSRVHLRSPVRSSLTCSPRMEHRPLGVPLMLPTPPLPATQVRGRDRP